MCYRQTEASKVKTGRFTHLEASAGVTRPRASGLIRRAADDGVARVEGGAVREVKVFGGDKNEGVDSLAVAFERPAWVVRLSRDREFKRVWAWRMC